METERLILRRYKEEDLQDYFEYVSDPEVVRYEPYKPLTMQDAQKDLNYRITSDEFIAVELKDTHKLIGNVYLGKRDFNTLEIGYVFNKTYWNKGYALESCKALIEDAFNNNVHRIYAECDPVNQNSWKLLERLGFEREAFFKQNVYFWTDENDNPLWKDTYVYSIINK